MALISEKVVVTAKEFLETRNINDHPSLLEPFQQTKSRYFNWDLSFSASSLGCEIIWKIAIGRDSLSEWQELDRLFSPSPIATHANFRGNKTYKTGNIPELGALVFWKRGNSWQGHMAIVTWVSEDRQTFDVIEFRALNGSEDKFINAEEKKGKRMGLPFCNDKLNLLGFVYCKNQEIR